MPMLRPGCIARAEDHLELLQAAVHQRLHRPHALPQDLRDMIVVQSLEVSQDEDLLVALAELEDGAADPGELPGLLSILGRVLPAAASHGAQASQLLLDRV